MIGKCDLPKAFDCLLLELIIVKLNGYMILACHLHVTDTQLFTELEAGINSACSSWEEIFFNVP